MAFDWLGLLLSFALGGVLGGSVMGRFRGVNLRHTQERWPQLTFHATREHAVKLE